MARRPKFAFVEPIVRIPGWQTLALISVAIAALLLAELFTAARSVHLGTKPARDRGSAAATTAVLIVYTSIRSSTSRLRGSILVGMLLIVGMLVLPAVLLAEAHEWPKRTGRARAAGLRRHRTRRSAHRAADPCARYNEPPGMVIESLDALAKLEYPDFEVTMIDNNTQDETSGGRSRPIAIRSAERFRSSTCRRWPGYKAGALNYALTQTRRCGDHCRIDSDYKVRPAWLHDLTPQVRRPNVAIVQAPQDYRDATATSSRRCAMGICRLLLDRHGHRNERNAIIQHGTMTLMRRDALERGGWGEWCITEDAELGLRLFEAGYDAYMNQQLRSGAHARQVPAYQKQRFRWAYGAMQVVRRHARALLSPADHRLTDGQKYHFVAGWLPWLADGLNCCSAWRRCAGRPR